MVAPPPDHKSSETEAEIHARKMAKRAQLQDAKTSARTIERGLVIVNTGKGKGKSTAAFGLALRTLARGGSVGVVQYIKGAWQTGERDFFERVADTMDANITFRAMGEGFTWNTASRDRDIAAAKAAWDESVKLLQSGGPDLVILDELNIALRYDYIDLETVIEALRARPCSQHVVITGRNAKPALMEYADTVSVIEAHKHHSAQGVMAQAGIEY